MANVLVVEDDKYLNKLLSDYLILSGHNVQSALDGEQAWARLEIAQEEQIPFECIVIDMLLPKIMGAQLLTKINESEEFSGIRKISMSGVYRSPVEIERIKALHQLDAYFTKPFDLEAMDACIRGEEQTESEDKMTRAGKLSHSPIELLFFQAYAKAFTGRLHLTWQDGFRTLYFLNGHPVSANSSSVSENFGNSLVRMGYIDKETREKASERMVAEKLHFGEMLIKMEAISKDKLFKALRRYTHEILTNAVISRQGEFEFIPLNELPDHLPHIEFNPFILMLRAQERLISVEALASLYNIKMDLYPHRSSRFVQLLPLLNLPGPAIEGVQNMPADMELRSFLQTQFGVTREQVLRCLYLFESMQLLEWKETPQEDYQLNGIVSTEFQSTEGAETPPVEDHRDEEIFSEYMDTLNQNFFELLEIDYEASSAEIDEAYRKIRFKKHPDRFGESLSGQTKRILDDVLARLDRAYQTLSDEEKRAEYLSTIRRLSADSAADSKRYLRAQELYREGIKLLDADKFADAKSRFEAAYETWQNGIEYKMYSLYSDFWAADPEKNEAAATKFLVHLRELSISHPYSELGFILIGHCHKALNQLSGARESYSKALEINENSKEASNALAQIATRETHEIKISRTLKKKKTFIFKALGLMIGIGLSGGALFLTQQMGITDAGVAEIDVALLKGIAEARSIRQKGDIAKIIVKAGWVQKIPEPVLKAKCKQILREIQKFGVYRIYLIDKEKGLAAFCTETEVQRYE